MRGAAAGRVFARGGAVVARPDAVASDPPSAGASAAPASGGFAAGLKAFDQGRHAEAFALWLPLAEQGRVEGQFNIAVMYEQGLGLAKDEAEAARWYLAAAERGDVAAQRKTGNLCEAGVGVPKDLGNASFWYGQAAKGAAKDAGAARQARARWRATPAPPRAEPSSWAGPNACCGVRGRRSVSTGSRTPGAPTTVTA